MSLAIENCKGVIHVFSDTGSTKEGGQGFYKLEGNGIPNEEGLVLILGIPLAFQEIVQPVVTLDDKRTLYVFGTAWNEIQLTGLLLLGPASTKGAQLSALIRWYNENRVSVLRNSIKLSLGTAAINAYVTGLRVDEANPNTHTQAFTVMMVTADIK